MTFMNAPVEFPARVVESFGRRAIVLTADGERLAAELFGKRISIVCGDEVQVRMPRPVAAASGDAPRIVSVMPRRTLLQRTDSRGRTEPLASNLTLLAAVIAPEPVIDAFVVDRYLAAAAYSQIDAAVIVNKSDLASSAAFAALVEEYRAAGYPVVSVSALNREAMDELRALVRGQSMLLAGQSGVGKSTLTNALIPDSAQLTRTLSDSTGEGRHTTVSTALFHIPTGGELIDSPGVRDFAPALVSDAMVQQGWAEIAKLSPNCRFNNCLHMREPGCAVIAGVEAGAFSARRYESYKRLLNLMRDLAPDYERRR
ncbi:ribosome small subunit-dependent GTPase A [Povalibacter sp.]|uniref:ribosome small subunit-dependent GTPase A n=1 Tax=Povalibacter sp. TaxID=1962978 RepID=UPI002F4294A4